MPDQTFPIRVHWVLFWLWSAAAHAHNRLKILINLEERPRLINRDRHLWRATVQYGRSPVNSKLGGVDAGPKPAGIDQSAYTVIFGRTLTVQNRATHPISFEQREASGASSPLTHRWSKPDSNPRCHYPEHASWL